MSTGLSILLTVGICTIYLVVVAGLALLNKFPITMSTGLKILLTVGISTIYLVVVAGLALLLAGWQLGKMTAFVRGAILGMAVMLLLMALSWVWRAG